MLQHVQTQISSNSIFGKEERSVKFFSMIICRKYSLLMNHDNFLWGFWVPQIWQLCLLTISFMWNVSLSVKYKQFMKPSSSSTFFYVWKQIKCFLLSSSLNILSSCNLCSFIDIFLYTTFHTIITSIWSSQDVSCIDFFGSLHMSLWLVPHFFHSHQNGHFSL